MALPASGPISGSQIATELGITGAAATNLSLGGLIASSSLSNTDPDAYSDFWGYFNSETWVSKTTSKKAQANKVDACNQSVNWTRYTTGTSSTTVSVGDKFAANSDGTGQVGSGYYKAGSGFATEWFLLDSSSPAEVTSKMACVIQQLDIKHKEWYKILPKQILK